MSALPFDQRDGFIWMNGNLVSWKEAKLHVLSHGLHYASCVFEGERAYGGRIFKSAEHSERFKTSAELLDFEIPYSVTELDKAKRLVVDKNNLPNCYVRPIAWRGSEMMAVAAPNSTINVAIAVWDWPSMFDIEQKMQGIRLDIADYRRPDPTTAPARAIYDLHHLETPRRAARLCRRDDVRLAGAGRRMHRRQYFLYCEGRDPHADRRLLSRRDHAAHGDRPREAARHRGDRASHHAGGALRIRGMFHLWHRRRGHPRVRGRPL